MESIDIWMLDDIPLARKSKSGDNDRRKLKSHNWEVEPHKDYDTGEWRYRKWSGKYKPHAFKCKDCGALCKIDYRNNGDYYLSFGRLYSYFRYKQQYKLHLLHLKTEKLVPEKIRGCISEEEKLVKDIIS